MNGRESILNALKTNKPAYLAPPAAWSEDLARDVDLRRETFIKTLQSIGGKTISCTGYEPIRAHLEKQLETGAFIVNTVTAIGDITPGIDTNSNAEMLKSVETAFIEGTLGVAENGAVWLYERQLVNRILPFICQHLVLVIRAGSLVSNLHEAYRTIEVGREGYGVFIAGPSKTADIEQSLVIGAHGARSLLVYLVD